MIPDSTDDYIAIFPIEVRKLLDRLRKTIITAAPNAMEKISYRMPTFYLNRNLVHFAAYKNHIGFYPTPGGIRAFKNKLSEYETSKGTIRFPIDKPLPLGLISAMVKFRVSENEMTATSTLKSKKNNMAFFLL